MFFPSGQRKAKTRAEGKQTNITNRLDGRKTARQDVRARLGPAGRRGDDHRGPGPWAARPASTSVPSSCSSPQNDRWCPLPKERGTARSPIPGTDCCPGLSCRRERAGRTCPLPLDRRTATARTSVNTLLRPRPSAVRRLRHGSPTCTPNTPLCPPWVSRRLALHAASWRRYFGRQPAPPSPTALSQAPAVPRDHILRMDDYWGLGQESYRPAPTTLGPMDSPISACCRPPRVVRRVR